MGAIKEHGREWSEYSEDEGVLEINTVDLQFIDWTLIVNWIMFDDEM